LIEVKESEANLEKLKLDAMLLGASAGAIKRAAGGGNSEPPPLE
jgi:hypothetical protein